LALGVTNTGQLEHEPINGGRWPVIVTKENQYLGLFGGMTSGYNQYGDLESAILLISSTGYIAPILDSGFIASLPLTYFKNRDCGGREYIPVKITQNGVLPYRGMVYRSLSSNNLAYIPKMGERKIIISASKIVLNEDRHVECANEIYELEAYEAENNSLKITGIDESTSYDLATVITEDAKNASRGQAVLNPIGTHISNGNVDVQGNNEDEQMECAPTCLTNVLGNGVCDAECFVESCFYDQGDCDNLTPDELHKKLSAFCSPGCDIGDIGDGFCDTPCNTDACQYDGGDCEQP
jgi:hypothetical protein